MIAEHFRQMCELDKRDPITEIRNAIQAECSIVGALNIDLNSAVAQFLREPSEALEGRTAMLMRKYREEKALLATAREIREELEKAAMEEVEA